jgi:hypothetical protein
VRRKRAKHAQLTDIVFATEQCSDIGQFSIADLAERGRDFHLLRHGEESISLDGLARLDGSDKMSVNRAAHESARACDFID